MGKNKSRFIILGIVTVISLGNCGQTHMEDSSGIVQAETGQGKTVEETAGSTVATTGNSLEKSDTVVLADKDLIQGGAYVADEEDESVIEAFGNVNATVKEAALSKVFGGASSADGSSFYGLNACVRVYGKAVVNLSDCQISASAKNATGVFAYEDGVIYMDHCTVDVTGGGAGGIQVAGGGSLYGTELTVTSASKAAIRSDRGGGTMVLDGGNYTSTGTSGCPAIYSTADITVSNARCISTGSRVVIIEGKNSVTLNNCTLAGNDHSDKEGSIHANVLLYHSMSGDAAAGVSTFTMNGGDMTCNSGAMFYCTNTASEINLEEAGLVLSDDGTLLIVSTGRWGKDGKNGGNCTLNAARQTLEGDVVVDAISSLTMNLTNSSFEGAIQTNGTVNVTMDEGSTWVLMGDSSVSSLNGNLKGIDLNGHVLYVDGMVWEG